MKGMFEEEKYLLATYQKIFFRNILEFEKDRTFLQETPQSSISEIAVFLLEIKSHYNLTEGDIFTLIETRDLTFNNILLWVSEFQKSQIS